MRESVRLARPVGRDEIPLTPGGTQLRACMVLIHFCRHSEAWHSCLSKDNPCHTSGSNVSALHTLGAESAMVLKQMAPCFILVPHVWSHIIES